MPESDFTTTAPASVRSSRPRPPRRGAARLRVGAIMLLLFVSAVLFVAIVSWQRDQTRIKAALDSATEVSTTLAQYHAQRGHLPFQLEGVAKRLEGTPEVPYPDRNAIYVLKNVTAPYVLLAGPRQGLLPPRDAGCAAIVFERGELRVEWMTMDRIAQEQRRRAELLIAPPVP